MDADKWTPYEGNENLHPDGYAAIHAISADRLYILGGYSPSAAETLEPEVYVFDTTGISSVRALVNHEFRLYPNPAVNQITIQSNLNGPFKMEITSLNGHLIQTENMEGPTHQIDLSSFQKGVYFITIRSNDFVRTRKIIKM